MISELGQKISQHSKLVSLLHNIELGQKYHVLPTALSIIYIVVFLIFFRVSLDTTTADSKNLERYHKSKSQEPLELDNYFYARTNSSKQLSDFSLKHYYSCTYLSII